MTIRTDFRLTGHSFRMSIQIINHWLKPSFRHFYITVEQDSVFRVYFLQSIVVAIGKTIILVQAYQVDRRKFFFYHLTRSIRGSIVGYINFRSLQAHQAR